MNTSNTETTTLTHYHSGFDISDIQCFCSGEAPIVSGRCFVAHTFFNGTVRSIFHMVCQVKNSLLYSTELHLAVFESEIVNTPKKHVQSGAESADVRIVPHFYLKKHKENGKQNGSGFNLCLIMVHVITSQSEQ